MVGGGGIGREKLKRGKEGRRVGRRLKRCWREDEERIGR